MKLLLGITCHLSMLVLVIAEEWSTWSECSRTCDGGAAYQLRRCTGQDKCEGGDRDIRYRTCNTQACPDGSEDFRSLQCSAYDDVTYGGMFYTWRPFYESRHQSDGTKKSRDRSAVAAVVAVEVEESRERKCALRCRAEGREEELVVTLAPKVLDGTRCDRHSDDMCISGRCWKVGCDKILGSDKQMDECGVCGGDGTTCKSRTRPLPRPSPRQRHDPNVLAADQPVTHDWSGQKEKSGGTFVWRETAFSECSVSCGIGQRQTAMVCYNVEGMKVVKDAFCPDNKPAHRARTCKKPSCGPLWITGEWQQCSRTCGGGVSRRPYYCVEKRTNASFQRLNDKRCTDDIPEHERKCNEFDCPKWFAGEWSPCSSTCGNGHQLRAVACKRTKEHDCAAADKPNVMRRCRTGVPCMGEKAELNYVGPDAPNSSEERYEDEHDDADLSGMEPRESTGEMERGGENEEGRRQGGFEGGVNIEDVPVGNRRPVVASGPPPTLRVESSDVDDPASPSGGRRGTSREQSLGGDSRYTDYESFLREINNNINRGMEEAEFWDKEAYDYRGWEVEEAQGVDTEEEEGKGEEEGRDQVLAVSSTPSFVASPWGRCSVTCGDGYRYRIVTCKVFLEFSQEVQTVDDKECAGEQPPQVEYCSNEDCPVVDLLQPPSPDSDAESELKRTYPDNYSWRFTGYGQCSAACMGGVEEPLFKCIRLSDYASVTDYYCARLPLPRVTARKCNDVPCPPTWRTYPFGQCSHACGGGVRRREVECIQELGKGDANVARRPTSLCPGQAPTESMPCNLMDCPPAWKEGQWSQCSVTCGTGVQRRDIVCKQRIIRGTKGELETKPDSVCEHLGKPLTLKPCRLPTCPSSVSGAIVTDPSKYIQLRPKNKLMLAVGGEAVLIPKTKVAVRCSVVKFNPKHLTWKTENGQELSRRGRVKVSRNGILRINKIRAEDAGSYTCVAGAHSANITISLHSSEAAMHGVEERRRYILANHKFITLVQDKIKLRKQRSRHPEEYTLPLVLRDFNHSTVPFAWVAGPWGECSQSCGGGAGLQSRPIACELVLADYALVTKDEGYCTALSPMRPLEMRDCGYHNCPVWGAGEWGACTDEVCVAPGKGARKRALHCTAHNGSALALSACDPAHRPTHRLECPQQTCKPMWKVSRWTDCSVSCGEGIRTRALQCVWVPNKLPAHRLCRRMPRPAVTKPCTGTSCSEPVCRDKSKYCSLVPKMNLCRLNDYHRKCCVSCTIHFHHMRLLQ